MPCICRTCTVLYIIALGRTTQQIKVSNSAAPATAIATLIGLFWHCRWGAWAVASRPCLPRRPGIAIMGPSFLLLCLPSYQQQAYSPVTARWHKDQDRSIAQSSSVLLLPSQCPCSSCEVIVRAYVAKSVSAFLLQMHDP